MPYIQNCRICNSGGWSFTLGIALLKNREEKLKKVEADIKKLRLEIHTFKQKNRDMEKSRASNKEKMKVQEKGQIFLRCYFYSPSPARDDICITVGKRSATYGYECNTS
jgi:hypothetical protein